MLQRNLLTWLTAAAVTAALAIAPQDKDNRQEPQEKSKTIKAVSEDGKLFIIDDKGEKREIDLSGAKSFTFRQSNRVVNQNGDEERQTMGQAIIVGPDGKQTVIELDGADNIELPGMNFKFGELDQALPEIQMPGLPDGAKLRTVFNLPELYRVDRGDVGKFMIGVHCEPVDDALRSHLQLDDGLGLIIKAVVDDAPASDAELKEHDILIYADETEMSSIKDLTAVVESAGEEERTITLTIVREGGEVTAKVTPKKRPENPGTITQGLQLGPGTFRVDRMGPGIIVDDNEDVQGELNRIREQMKQMRDEMKQMMERDK